MSADSAVILSAEIMSYEPSDRLAALFDAHEDRLYRLARRLTPMADDARDLVHDTFVKAAAALTTIPTGLAKEEAWLVRVLINLRRDQWRKAAVRRRSASLVRAGTITSINNVESSLATKRAVWAALDLLQPRRRAIVIMHELEGQSTGAIASLLGVSKVTVQWHLSMARRELKEVLSPYLRETT
jgi:RNA polymerase sigma factor (sigma-70 family)